MSETNLSPVAQHISKLLRLHNTEAPTSEITNLANNIAFLIHFKVGPSIPTHTIFLLKIFVPAHTVVPRVGRYRMAVVQQQGARCNFVVGVMDEVTPQETVVVRGEVDLWTGLCREVAGMVEGILDAGAVGE